jgi:hypothetical protein
MFLTGHRATRPPGDVNKHSTLPEPLPVTDFASTVNSVGLSRNTPTEKKMKSREEVKLI